MVRNSAVAVALVLSTAAAYAQGAFDGVYRSPEGGIPGNARCGTTRFGFPLQVKGGTASLRTITAGTLEGPVGPDGTVNIQEGTSSLTGKIASGRFDGTLAMGRSGCAFTLAYTR